MLLVRNGLQVHGWQVANKKEIPHQNHGQEKASINVHCVSFFNIFNSRWISQVIPAPAWSWAPDYSTSSFWASIRERDRPLCDSERRPQKTGTLPWLANSSTFRFQNWARFVESQWTLEPLSYYKFASLWFCILYLGQLLQLLTYNL